MNFLASGRDLAFIFELEKFKPFFLPSLGRIVAHSALVNIILLYLFTNILSDYLALFIIRHRLSRAIRPVVALHLDHSWVSCWLTVLVFLRQIVVNVIVNSVGLLDAWWRLQGDLGVANLSYIAATSNSYIGKDHPLDALGFVAAPLIFLVAVAVQTLVST
jgi:hypothetical protein